MAVTEYGVGSIAKDISNTDLLTTLTSAKGGYYMGINVTNAPDTNWWFYIVVCHNPSWATVLALSFTGNNHVMHIGQYTEGNWAGWKQIATTAFVQNAVSDKATTADITNALNDKITYGITDLTAGTSPLATGKLYFVYE